MKQLIKLVLPQVLINKYKQYEKNKNIKKNKGENVHCPICNSLFEIFGPYGIVERKNAKCHNCDSLERHRLIYLYINNKLNLFDKKIKVLHFAPEKMFYDIFSNNNKIEYTPCDLSPEIYQYNGKTKIIKVDITKIPFDDNYFDFILCSHVLEHIPNDNLAMSELYRVLSKGGNSILQVPIDDNRNQTYEDENITSPEERLKAFGQHDHVRIYGKDYKKRLLDSGFIVNEDNYITTFNKSEIYKYGLNDSELIYHCRK